MVNTQSEGEQVGEVDTALLDADLFVKYQSPERAINRLRAALERNPRSIQLRERLRELSTTYKHADEGARQCLALASLYIERDDFDSAYDRLLEAKQLDARINVAAGLEAIRRARRPDLRPAAAPAKSDVGSRAVTLAGDLATISLFDAIQVLENARLTGVVLLIGEAQTSRVLFNKGRIVDAESAGCRGEAAFRHVVEITNGTFEFQKSEQEFPIMIQAASNTNLILDVLRRLDEEKQ